MFDCIVQGGFVVDGTGAETRRADVAINDGVIVEVGEALGRARQVVDVDGLTVCPGFIDIHTHYDAQIVWDPWLTPSSHHGVTTVMAGSCGYSVAPLGNDSEADYVFKMMARVEGIPSVALESGIEVDWRSFGEWVDRFKGNIAVNVGFLVGHSTLRHFVMKNASRERAATEAEIAAMARILDESIAAGALGFSTSQNQPHYDADGIPVPSRHAASEEMVALASVVSRYPGTTLQIAPHNMSAGFTTEDMELMAAMSRAGNRPLNWNLLKVLASQVPYIEQQLAASDYAKTHGGLVIALVNGEIVRSRVNFRQGVMLDTIPRWGHVLNLPMDERIAALRSPDVRNDMLAGVAEFGYRPQQIESVAASLVPMEVEISRAPENTKYLGRTIGEISEDERRRPIDVALDIALADDLRTIFRLPPLGNDSESWKLRSEVWTDPRVIVGGSDAGAHLDMLCGGTSTTAFLRENRERELMSFPRAVFEITGAPAALLGLENRGRIAPGCVADLVVLDPISVDTEPLQFVADLPGKAERLTANPRGIHRVLVGGEVIIESDEPTGVLPGRVLRPGMDTSTVSADRLLSKPPIR